MVLYVLDWDDITGINTNFMNSSPSPLANASRISLMGDMATASILEGNGEPYSMYINSHFILQKYNTSNNNWESLDILGENNNIGGTSDQGRYYRYSPVNEVIRRTGTGATSSDVCGVTRQLSSTKPSTNFSE